LKELDLIYLVTILYKIKMMVTTPASVKALTGPLAGQTVFNATQDALMFT
jgi:iron complex outermembrane receptor protein